MTAQPRPHLKSLNLVEIAIGSDRSEMNDLIKGSGKPGCLRVEKDEAHAGCGSFMSPVNRKRIAEALTLNFRASASI